MGRFQWSSIRREQRGLCNLGRETLVTYVRMSCTVVVAVVVRLCLDCLGIIFTGQNPTAVVFWFAHCQQDGVCIFVAFFIFVVSLLGASFFAWHWQDWIIDPTRNPYARHLSFKILLDAMSWVPISVVIGKTNALVEWCMDITQDDLAQVFLSSAISALLTFICALLTHVSMKHCRGVASQGKVKEAGVMGYGKFLILTTLSCLGWAVGWSLWALVMALMDALQPGEGVHSTALVVGVISLSVLCTTCFYLRYGPEPVIPDPLLQQLCYGHGYSSSVRRAFMSYLVYACMVFLVMCCADPTYGLLHVVAVQLKAQLDPALFDSKALMVLFGICAMVTILATLISAAITRLTRVDMESSMKLSRSAYEVRQRLVQGRSSDAELLGYEQMMQDACNGLDSFDDDLDSSYMRQVSPDDSPSPRCGYSAIELSMDPRDEVPCIRDRRDSSSDGSLEIIDRIAVSRSLCISILFYDVMAFVVCTLWGTFAVRLFFVVFGRIASIHSVLYILSSLTYAVLCTLAVMRGCLRFFPSEAEQRLKNHEKEFTREELEVASPEPFFPEPFELFSEPFLEVPDAGLG